MEHRYGRSGIAVVMAALAVVTATAFAEIEVWRSGYNGTANDWDSYLALALTPDSAVAAAGYVVNAATGRDVVVAKLRRSTGETLWVRTWNRSGTSFDMGLAVAVDAAGNIFVAGKTYTAATDSDYVTLKYEPDGTLAWAQTYHNAGGDVARAVVPDGRGGVFVTGRSNAVAGNAAADYLTIHYDASGSARWTARYNGPGNAGDFPTAAVLDRAGNLYVTGYSWTGSVPQYDYCTVRYDTTSGDTVWVRRYDGTASSPKADFAYGITTDDSGYIYVTGRAGEVGSWYDATTVKYHPNGGQVWVNRFDAGDLGLDGGSHIAVDAGYRVFVAGFSESESTAYDGLVFRINQQDNSVVWYRRFNHVNDDDSTVAMAVDAAGNCYLLVSVTTFEGDYDWATVKYTAAGTRAWTAYLQTYDEDDEPFAAAVDERGDVYCAGYYYPVSSENCVVVKYTETDVGALRVVFPADTFRTRAQVVPRAWVRNYSGVAQSFSVRMEISGGIYYDSRVVSGLAPYDSALVEFEAWPVRDVGTFAVSCFTVLSTDKEPGNDTARGSVTGVEVWEFLAGMPAGPKNRGVKDGGALTAVDSFVFALKGNNSVEFYRYNINQQTWVEVDSMPPLGSTGSKKRVKAGGSLTADSSGYVYALKGNNTAEFFRYSVSGDTWRSLAEFPTGSGRRVKGGGGLAYVPALHRIYAVKGNNTLEFAWYDIAAGTWHMAAPIPAGDRNKKAKDGTVLASDGVNTCYLLKGGTNEFFAYDIAANQWRPLKPIPNSYIYAKKRKMKKGGAGAFDYRYNRFYAMKGGKTCEFWYYDPGQDSWVSVDDSFPRPLGTKPPYNGASLCYGSGKIYALRGNKTLDFLRYNADLPLEPGGGVQAGPAALRRLDFTVWPNPVFNQAALQVELPVPARVKLALYDVSGRQAAVVFDGAAAPGRHSFQLDARGLAGGVYLLRLSAETGTASIETGRKLMVVR